MGINNKVDHNVVIEEEVIDPFGVTDAHVEPHIRQDPTLPAIEEGTIANLLEQQLKIHTDNQPHVVCMNRSLDKICDAILGYSIDEFSMLPVDVQRKILLESLDALKNSVRQDGPLHIGFHGSTEDHLDSLKRKIDIVETMQVGGDVISEEDIESYLYQLFTAATMPMGLACARAEQEHKKPILTFIYSDPKDQTLGVLTGGIFPTLAHSLISNGVVTNCNKRNEEIGAHCKSIGMNMSDTYELHPNNKTLQGSPYIYHGVSVDKSIYIGNRSIEPEYLRSSHEVAQLLVMQSIIAAFKADVRPNG